MKKRAIVAAAGLTVGIMAGAEWYLRRRDHEQNRDRWFHEGYDGSHPYNLFHNRSGWELMPGYDVAGIRINAHGFRGDDFTRRKPAGTIRIMCLGDSCTFGAAGDESPYPYQLQQCLDEIELEGFYHILNAGVEGHASINALLRLPRLLTFQPDILVIYLGWNDMWSGNPKHYPDLRRKTRSYWHYGNGLQTPSVLLNRAIETLDIDVPPPPISSFDLDAFVPTNFEFNMRRAIRISRKAGVRVALVTLPSLIPDDVERASLRLLEKLHYPSFFEQGDLVNLKHLHQTYNHSITRLAVEENIDFIDLNAVFDSMDSKRDTCFYDTWHPTPEGSLLIARTLAQGLYDRKIIE